MRIALILCALVFGGSFLLLGSPHLMDCSAETSALGPFHFSLPVLATAEQASALERAMAKAYGHSILSLSVKDGVMTCYAGGDGPDALLRLGELEKVLAKAGVRCDRDRWVVKPQELGICVSAKGTISSQDLEKVFESLPDTD